MNRIGAALKKQSAKRKFRNDLQTLRQQEQATAKRFRLDEHDLFPCLNDASGSHRFDRHYIYHTAWAARRIANRRCKEHVDISSLLYFSTLISAFVPVRFYDHRPAAIELSDLSCEHVDLTQLPFAPRSIDSLSCMHVVEHVGLGRYGDRLDYDGDVKAMRSLANVLAPGGELLFVVPIAAQARIDFNAHRVYQSSDIINTFNALGLTLKEFALLPDRAEPGGLVISPNKDLLARQRYACGCFCFTRPPAMDD